MMDLKQYVKDAVRTESRIDTVVANKELLQSVLEIYIASATMLDYIKKNVFYGKPIDQTDFDMQWYALDKASAYLNPKWTQPKYGHDHVTSEKYKSDVTVNPRLFHALIGAMTEGGEIGEALLKVVFEGKTLDDINVLEEFGDINWYEAIAVDELGGDLQAILERNIAKLKARFPEKFTQDNAINRDLETERKILEGK